MSALVTIRPAAAGDAAHLADLGRRTFTEAFAAFNTAEDLRLFLNESYTEALQAQELMEPAALHLIAEAEGEPIGFARLRKGDVPDCVVGTDPQRDVIMVRSL